MHKRTPKINGTPKSTTSEIFSCYSTCVCRAPYAIDVGLDMGAYIIYQRTAPSSAAEKTRDSEAEGLSRQLQQTDRN